MRVNEIFYSLQGEGRYTGTPCVFVRFSGCNLKCSFCDTEHQEWTELSEENVIDEIEQYPCTHVVFTGGEPMLQLTQSLVDELQSKGHYIQVETNGSVDNDVKVDWVTCSPKHKEVVLQHIDEIKVVYQGAEQDMEAYKAIPSYEHAEKYLQPCDVKDERKNEAIISQTLDYIKENPIWKLSLQTQKILRVR